MLTNSPSKRCPDCNFVWDVGGNQGNYEIKELCPSCRKKNSKILTPNCGVRKEVLRGEKNEKERQT